uniref:Uncharacterized protein n=1 Tax=Candidatus Kentrum sp. DK TaxID=2126562 RepID=A0A450SQW7_9GAMM|nr:MAG: hypothetical protein BECKDK2373B_GA0170837_10575 [Candidatus Kentron sp. DK]
MFPRLGGSLALPDSSVTYHMVGSYKKRWHEQCLLREKGGGARKEADYQRTGPDEGNRRRERRVRESRARVQGRAGKPVPVPGQIKITPEIFLSLQYSRMPCFRLVVS